MSGFDDFAVVGARPVAGPPVPRVRRVRAGMLLPGALLALIMLGCLCCGLFAPGEPGYMDLSSCSLAPCREHPFGTDSMGRDIFALIWHGGRVSLLIGFSSTALSTLIAVIYGSLSGLAPRRLDALLMRALEIVLSIPSLRVIVLLQAAFGRGSAAGLSVVIGLTGWMSIARVVRAQVRQLRKCEYVLASRCMGGRFLHILRRHLAPNFIPSVMFMIVMNVRGAIIAESTLSFMGLGLPLDVVSWGSMLSLSENALSGRQWWIILIPGLFLMLTLLCLTSLAEGMRKGPAARHSNL